jgi:hypothetical protein
MQTSLPARLSVEQQQLIEVRVANERKSVGLAYLFWFFLGGFAIHNFYLGKIKLAIFQLLGGLFSLILMVAGGAGGPAGMGTIGVVGVILLGIWFLSFLADLFLIPGRVAAYSEGLRARYAEQLSGH